MLYSRGKNIQGVNMLGMIGVSILTGYGLRMIGDVGTPLISIITTINNGTKSVIKAVMLSVQTRVFLLFLFVPKPTQLQIGACEFS